MRRFSYTLCLALVLTGCGYRAPLYKSYIPQVTDTTLYSGVRADYQELAALMDKDTGLKPTEGNTVSLITDGAENWEMIIRDLASVETSAYIEPYIFRLDSCGTRLVDILQEKARAGADVRIILDRAANTKDDREALEELEETGIQVNIFRRPVFILDHHHPRFSTHRNHRKLLLLDGRTAYVGSRNIQIPYFNDWRDADIRITGPAVADLTEAFQRHLALVAPLSRKPYVAPDLESAACTDSLPGKRQTSGVTVQVVPEAPIDQVLPIRNCIEWTLLHAKDYFWYYNPYSPPPASTVSALKNAALRGVDVRWIVPAVNDVFIEKAMAESLYKDLLGAGVRIYEWQGPMMHAKQYICDDYLTVIGSANMDNLSFFLNYELVAVLYDETLSRQSAALFRSDLEHHCHEVTLEQVNAWTGLHKLRNWFTRLLGGLLG